MLEVRIAGGGAKPGNSGEIKLVFQITVDDVKITKENFTMVLDIIKFIDQNYSEMVYRQTAFGQFIDTPRRGESCYD